MLLSSPSIPPRNNSFTNFKLETAFEPGIIEDDIEAFKRYFKKKAYDSEF